MPLQVRLPDDLVARIDNLRDPLVPREAYIRELVTYEVQRREQAKATKRKRARTRKAR